jgi:hypothetical protein
LIAAERPRLWARVFILIPQQIRSLKDVQRPNGVQFPQSGTECID